MNSFDVQGTVESRTFEEIAIGETASITRTFTAADGDLLALLTGEPNIELLAPDAGREDAASSELEPRRGASLQLADASWCTSLIDAILHHRLPGAGARPVQQSFSFLRPLSLGESITASVTVTGKDPDERRVSLACLCRSDRGDTVLQGTAEVLARSAAVRGRAVRLPEVHLQRPHMLFDALIERARPLGPVRTAIVHPVNSESLLGAFQAAEEGLIMPVLVGPADRIRARAAADETDISRFELLGTAHSHDSAASAVRLARNGDVEALLKGDIHTDELMAAAVSRERGLTTDRRMSHVFVVDVPAYPRPLLITDAAINVEPDLTAKRDIVQNAIDLAHALGLRRPKIAVLSSVETVSEAIASSLDAAALAKMAERGQILGGIVDGPLAFDNAISAAAAERKGIRSPVAGRADVIVVPHLDTGNMLVKQLDYLAGSQAAGIVLGGRVPIALTSRADGIAERVASCALAVLLAHRTRRPRRRGRDAEPSTTS